MGKHFQINELFYSLQGEGVRAGTANVFIRFSGCNLKCKEDTEGFNCDTEFDSGRKYTAEQLIEEATALAPKSFKPNDIGVIFTGGEPTLQVTPELVDMFKAAGFTTCLETNGIKVPPANLDWISCSPKTAEHTLNIEAASELRYVRNVKQGIPRPRIKADHYCISPAFDSDWTVSRETLQWCIALCKDNPPWRLSVQQHKRWKIR